MNTTGGQNLRLGAIQQILGQIGKTAGAVTTGLGSFTGGSAGWGSGYGNSRFGSTDGSGASFYLSVLFNFVMYVLILFIVLLVVHFTYRPIFSFLPSDKGFLPIPGLGDSRVYWNDKTQPLPEDPAPKQGTNVKDPLLTNPFKDNFSFSLDVLVKQLPSSDQKNRVILYKAPYYGEDILSGSQASVTSSGGTQTKTITTVASPFTEGPGTDLVQYFTSKASMVLYLNETNDLIVLFYSTAANKPYASRPIRNIPLNTPFRIGVTVENKIFSVYLNGKFVFQRFVPEGFSLTGGNSRFYTPPSWNTTTKSIYVQNLILWPRAINSVEVREATPALALRPDFDAGEDPDTGICAS